MTKFCHLRRRLFIHREETRREEISYETLECFSVTMINDAEGWERRRKNDSTSPQCEFNHLYGKTIDHSHCIQKERE